jgi:hypothetical protein
VFRPHVSLLACLIGALLWSSSAHADDVLAAQGLFEDGLRLYDAGRFDEACPKFAESQRMAPAGGTITNLARCHEQQGRLATAVAEYDAALAQAIADRRTDRESFIRERLLALTPRVPKVTITTAAALPSDVEVRLDATIVTASMREVKLPIDPGNHELRAVGAGTRSWSHSFSIAAGDTLNVEIPALSAASTPTVVERPATLRWILLGSGIALGVAGGVALIPYSSAKTTQERECVVSRNYCMSDAGRDAGANARLWAGVSVLGIAAGAVLVVSSFFVRSERVSSATSAAKSP